MHGDISGVQRPVSVSAFRYCAMAHRFTRIAKMERTYFAAFTTCDSFIPCAAQKLCEGYRGKRLWLTMSVGLMDQGKEQGAVYLRFVDCLQSFEVREVWSKFEFSRRHTLFYAERGQLPKGTLKHLPKTQNAHLRIFQPCRSLNITVLSNCWVYAVF